MTKPVPSKTWCTGGGWGTRPVTHVVPTADLQHAEGGLDGGGAALDVDAFVAGGVAVVRRGLRGDGVGDADVGVAEHEPAAGDRVGGLVLLAGEQVVQPQ